MQPIPTPLDCCEASCSTTPINLPGPKGDDGEDGSDGSDGLNAYTTLTATFTMPAELASAAATVADNSWAIVGMVVTVGALGSLQIMGTSSTTGLTLKNLKSTGASAYMSNAAPGTVAGATTLVTPSGSQGPAGSLTGTAGADLEGTYPNPTLKITTTKGDLIVNFNGVTAPRNVALSMGTDKYVIHAVAGSIPTYKVIDLTGAGTALSGALGLTNGGTGTSVATLQLLLNYLLGICNSKGKFPISNGTNIVAATPGTNGYALTWDSTTASGLSEAAIAPSSALFVRQQVTNGTDNVNIGTTIVGVQKSTAGGVSLALYAGAGYPNKVIIVKDELGNAATKNITITPFGAETIDGAPNLVLSTDWAMVSLYFNGTNWLTC